MRVSKCNSYCLLGTEYLYISINLLAILASSDKISAVQFQELTDLVM